MGAQSKALEISSIILGKRMNVSQQTASRRLQQLEEKGWLSREITRKGQFVRLTDQGMNILLEIYLWLQTIFDKKPPVLIIEGELFSGMREGGYYISEEGYKRQFKEKLGFEPYPGTLNLKLKSHSALQAKKALQNYPGIIIEQFENKGRTFGSVKCFKTLINDKEEGAVLLIQRTHYGEDVLEVISPERLREKMKLKDGEKVRLKIFLTQVEEKES
jgi:riboflavin kinase